MEHNKIRTETFKHSNKQIIEITMIPTQAAQVGDVVTQDGRKFNVEQEFVNGNDARNSKYRVFMNCPKGVYGLTEVTE